MIVKVKIWEYKTPRDFHKTGRFLDLSKLEDINFLHRKMRDETNFKIAAYRNLQKLENGDYDMGEIELWEV